MRIAYITTYDANNVKNWSGLGFYIAKSLLNQGATIDFIGPLNFPSSPEVFVSKVKSRMYKYIRGQSYILDREPRVLCSYARQITQRLKNCNVDIIFCPGTTPIAYLESQKPLVFWTDATFAGLLNFYPGFFHIAAESIKHAHDAEQRILQKCSLAIYSSVWAAETAINFYGAKSSKVKVVPFGANVECNHSIEEVKSFIDLRPTDQCRLLFVGAEWQRKGGDIAVKIAEELNRRGLTTELTIVGASPTETLPKFVTSYGYLAKANPETGKLINKLLAESHFLVLPARADCTPVVISEASAFGLPSIASNIGGISSIVKDGINGKTFELDILLEESCSYIEMLMSNRMAYKTLALSAYNEYETYLNWKTTGRAVKRLMEEVIQ